MKYERMVKGRFLERPNRFIAYVEIAGKKETVHVKNTGRCKELLVLGATVYLQKSDNPERKTQWDLISVEKGRRMINMDSQIPNKVVEEWIRKGHLFPDVTLIRPETTFGKSRFDLYVEAGERKIFMEIKGVTLEEDGIVRFPDAPTERGVKHVEELCEAVKAGYEAYLFFVIQMEKVQYFAPNMVTHAAFGEAMRRAKEQGVHILAYECKVEKDSIEIDKSVPVILGPENLHQMAEPIVNWYRTNKRKLPWRDIRDPYRIWLSEIMLQQTRVEAVKPFYERFLSELPTIKDLAEVPEEKLLKLWEGLGYYNRARNLQKAARQIMEEHEGVFPSSYEEIVALTGIGSYTAGAIASFAFDIAKPAVDGNVLRVISRLTGSYDDIMKAGTKTKVEAQLSEVIPKGEACDFNQGLIELGALVCVPNGAPKCESCPLAHLCVAHKEGLTEELPVKAKAKARKVEKKTILIYQDGETVAIRQREKKGLLAGLYELPNVEGHLNAKQVIAHSKEIGLLPIHIKKLPEAKHIFSHVEWQMIGYVIRVDELEANCKENMIFAHPTEVEQNYPIPAAFEAYTKYLNIKLGQEKYEE